MSFIAAYVAGFTKTYPQSKVEVRQTRAVQGRPAFRIAVNGDFGDQTYSEFDIRLATRAFERGAPTRVYHRATAKLGDMARFVS